MDLNVNIEAMRIIIIQDEKSEQSPALLLSVPALRLGGGLATSAAKNKVSGMGVKKRKAGRPRKGRDGGALFPAGNYGPSD
jgi:hypothetical protein